jgi:hypothetical protein
MPPIIFKFLKRNVIAQKPTQGEGIVMFVHNYLYTFAPGKWPNKMIKKTWELWQLEQYSN